MSTIDDRIEKHERLAEKAIKSIDRANDIIIKATTKRDYHEAAIVNLKAKKVKAKPKQIVTEILDPGVIIIETLKKEEEVRKCVLGDDYRELPARDPEDSKPGEKYGSK